MKVYLGSDHNGFHLKEDVFAYLSKRGFGDEDGDARAILLCGGGQGMCMAANRFRGIRASVICDEYEAKMTRNDNDSNVLCLPSRLFENGTEWQAIVDTWLNTPFANAERYRRRNRQLDELA